MNFDDAPDESLQAQGQQAPPSVSFDDAPDESQPSSSAMGSALRGAAQSALPTTAGLVSGIEAAGVGARVGGAVAGAPGAIIGGLGAGLIVGTGVGGLAQKGQDWLTDKIGISSPEQRAADEQQHPYASLAGQLAPAALTLSPGKLATPIVQRLLSGGMLGGIEAGQEYANEGTVDPGKVAIAAGVGAALPNAKPWVENLSTSMKGGISGRPNVPKPPEAAQEQASIQPANDITMTAPGVAADNQPAPDIEVMTAATPMGERSEREYPKDNAKPQQPGAETSGITQGDNAPDMAAALSSQITEPEAPVAQQGTAAPTPEPAPQPVAPVAPAKPAIAFDTARDEAPPIQTGLADRRVQDIVRQDIDRRRNVMPAARGNGTLPNDQRIQLTPEEQNAPAAQPGMPAAKQTVNVLGKDLEVPGHVAAVLNSPAVKAAIEGGAVKAGDVPFTAGASKGANTTTNIDSRVPKIAVLPGGKSFATEEPMRIHEQVEKPVMEALTKGGMDDDSAYSVSHWDFAQPAEDAYYKALGLNPQHVDAFWDRLATNVQESKVNPKAVPSDLYKAPYPGENPDRAPHVAEAVDKPTPEQQQQASDILAKVDLSNLEPLGNDQGKTAPTREAPSKTAMGNEPVMARLRKMGGGWADVADQIDKLGPDDRVKAIAEATKQLPRVPQNRPKLEGSNITGRSRADVARKQGALDATKSAFAKFGVAPDDETNGALLDRAKAGVAHAIEENNGINPTDRKTGYAPNVKPAEWQWVKAAQQLVAKPTPANISKFKATEELLRGGGAADTQATKRIEADIEKSNRPTSELAEQASPAVNQGFASREVFEPVPEVTGGDLSLRELQDQNKLRSWINDLDDVDYKLLENKYPEGMRTEVEATQDPEELLRNMQDDLTEAQTKRPGILVHGGEEVKGKPVPVTSRADLAPTEPGRAASPVRSLTGEARAQAAADALAKINAKSTKENAIGYEAPDRVTEEENAIGYEAPDRVTEEEKAYQNSWSNVTDKFKEMMGDENASVKLPSWLTRRPNDPLSPDANQNARDYGESLGDQFNDHRNRIINTESKIRANMVAAPDLTPEEWKQMNRAMENRDVKSLPQNLQDAYNQSIAPLKDMYNRGYDQLQRAQQASMGIEPENRLPTRNVGVSTDFVPRNKLGEDRPEKDLDDPLVSLRSLNDWRPATQARDFFALDDGKGGPRLIMKPGDGEMTVFRNGSPRTIGVPHSFTGEVGDKIELSFKGGNKGVYTVDHATSPEIMQHVKDDNGEPLKYVENPLFGYSKAVREIHDVLSNQLLLNKVANDTRLLENVTTSKEEAKAKGYSLEPTKLAQFATGKGIGMGQAPLYMAKPLKYAMDDYARTGFDDAHFQKLRNVSTALLKTMYTLGPFLHALNEADLWATSRGFDWITPAGTKSLVKNGYTAIKSVLTQDDLQHGIRAVGGNTMLGSTLNRGLIQQIADKAGVELTKDPSKWDPITKMFGVDVPSVAKWMNHNSNKLMWAMSDVLATHKVLENMDVHGMSMSDAVKDMHEFISDYRMPTTILGSRGAAKGIADPAISAFGRYHMGLWNTYARMGSRMLGPDSTTEQRVKAAGQFMVMGAMAFGIYPLLDKAAKKITGNEGAEYGRRGASVIPHVISQIAQGGTTGKGLESLIPDVYTPSLPISAAIEGIKNKDWTGKAIIPPMDYSNPRNVGTAAARAADFAGRQLVPPYNTVAGAATHPGATPGSVAGNFVGTQLGLKQPSQAAQKYVNKMPTHVRATEKANVRHPGGVLEEIYNSLTR